MSLIGLVDGGERICMWQIRSSEEMRSVVYRIKMHQPLDGLKAGK
jgi:hypothetical protein